MDHPIGQLMQTTLEHIKDMVDVNTVVGDAIHTPDGATVIPISKVSFGFVSGGGEYDKHGQPELDLPFAGGSGAGVSVQPVGFLTVGEDGVRLIPAQNLTAWERAVNSAPQIIDDLRALIASRREKSPQEGMIQ